MQKKCYFNKCILYPIYIRQHLHLPCLTWTLKTASGHPQFIQVLRKKITPSFMVHVVLQFSVVVSQVEENNFVVYFLMYKCSVVERTIVLWRQLPLHSLLSSQQLREFSIPQPTRILVVACTLIRTYIHDDFKFA
jgi:hypothetical protein